MNGEASDTTVIRHLCVRLAQLEVELRQARVDPVTGLPTRALFEQLAMAAYPSSTAVVMADIDGFKEYNDQLSHAEGDRLLRQLAGRLRRVFGTGGVLGRIGGDEFAAVLPSCPRDLDAVHRALTPEPVETSAGIVRAGLSIGVAQRDHLDGATFRQALHGADLAMYAVKAAGGGWRLYDKRTHGSLEVTNAPVRRVRHHGVAALAR